VGAKKTLSAYLCTVLVNAICSHHRSPTQCLAHLATFVFPATCLICILSNLLLCWSLCLLYFTYNRICCLFRRKEKNVASDTCTLRALQDFFRYLFLPFSWFVWLREYTSSWSLAPPYTCSLLHVII
jgi:hypothetical protein